MAEQGMNRSDEGIRKDAMHLIWQELAYTPDRLREDARKQVENEGAEGKFLLHSSDCEWCTTHLDYHQYRAATIDQAEEVLKALATAWSPPSPTTKKERKYA